MLTSPLQDIGLTSEIIRRLPPEAVAAVESAVYRMQAQFHHSDRTGRSESGRIQGLNLAHEVFCESQSEQASLITEYCNSTLAVDAEIRAFSEAGAIWAEAIDLAARSTAEYALARVGLGSGRGPLFTSAYQIKLWDEVGYKRHEFKLKKLGDTDSSKDEVETDGLQEAGAHYDEDVFVSRTGEIFYRKGRSWVKEPDSYVIGVVAESVKRLGDVNVGADGAQILTMTDIAQGVGMNQAVNASADADALKEVSNSADLRLNQFRLRYRPDVIPLDKLHTISPYFTADLLPDLENRTYLFLIRRNKSGELYCSMVGEVKGITPAPDLES